METDFSQTIGTKIKSQLTEINQDCCKKIKSQPRNKTIKSQLNSKARNIKPNLGIGFRSAVRRNRKRSEDKKF